MRRQVVLVMLLMMVGWSAGSAAEPPIDNELQSLKPLIGGYPPSIKSAEQRAAVIKRYRGLKARLDAEVKAHPDDVAVRFQRATLEDMGHNIDIDGAFDQAKVDYTYVIDHHAGDIQAMLGLATLLVNTSPTYANEARSLFVAAQCSNGVLPLEEAQRGLFFAHYYAGDIAEAKARSRYLVKHWPNNKIYSQLDATVDAVLARTKNSGKVPDDPDLETCKGKP